MAALGSKLRSVEGGYISYWCPGCGGPHTIPVSTADPKPEKFWKWDANIEAPTIDPSILSRTNVDNNGERMPDEQMRTMCHHFVRKGVIEYLNDCAHALKGQHVPIPDWPKPDWND